MIGKYLSEEEVIERKIPRYLLGKRFYEAKGVKDSRFRCFAIFSESDEFVEVLMCEKGYER